MGGIIHEYEKIDLSATSTRSPQQNPNLFYLEITDLDIQNDQILDVGSVSRRFYLLLISGHRQHPDRLFLDNELGNH